MKIWIRRIYFVLAVVIFLLASTFFILLASGYNYNILKNKFEKTSVLYVKSYPRNANIFLNEKLYKKLTPTEIIHLKPNLYNVKIEKEEYQKWEKQFLVKPEQTVFIEEVSLFYKSPKVSILKNGNFKSLSISPDKQNLLFYDLENEELNIFNLTENRIINLEKDIDEMENTLWSSDNKKVLLEIDDKYFISFVYFNEELLNLSKYISFSPKNIVWDKFDSNLIYLTTDSGSLYKFDLNKKILEDTGITNVLAVKPEKNNIFYISNKDEKDVLYLFDSNKGEKEKILDLGANLNYNFIWPYRDYFCLLDSNKVLYLIDPNVEKYLINKFYNIENLEWDLYNRTILLKNNFEIWSYDLPTEEEILINRFSKNIENIFWHKNNNHIFYVIDGQLNVIELDNRDKKNIYLLENIHDSNLFLANKKGNILYYITPSGLVESIIQ